MPELKLSWLGTPVVELDGQQIRLEMRKVTALLAYLSLHPEGISREVIASMLWPDKNQQHAMGSLRRTLSSLSTSLAPFEFYTDRNTIRLPEESQARIDVGLFESKLHRVGLHHPDGEDALCLECITILEEAARLYRGEFLAGFNLNDCPAFDEWQDGCRQNLRDEAETVLLRLARAYACRQDWENAIPAARRGAAMDPLNEAPQRELMKLYAQAGQRSAALRQYEILLRQLEVELGQEPEPETTRLLKAIQRNDLTLASPSEKSQASTGSPLRDPEPLIKTKLFISPLRGQLVPRRRLLELMDSGCLRPLTLISAPAGFGKTTLLAHWAAHTSLPVAWFSIDEGDNDPLRFLSYLTAALDSAVPEIGGQYLDTFQSLQPSVQPILTGLINHLSTLSDDFVLILDDYQFIHSAEVHNTLAALLERMPRCLHLVISTRSDPPLPLARLRARDQLVEIRAADLRFSGEESHGFLNQVMSLGLSGEDISALETRTEGWIAGLQMAALAIRTMPVSALRGPAGGSVSEFIHAFSGSNRYILDYLGEEVLSRRSASTQQFLLETSILGRLSGPLCDAVTGLKGTQETLLELEKENLFLIPLDSERQWYRYHHLFAELLRYQLEKTASTGDESMGGNRPGTGELHRRAAEWFQENQAAGEAISHYFAAGLQEQAASLIETQSEHMVFVTGQVYTLLEWLNNLSPEIYKTKPNLYFARMMAFITHSEYAAAGEVVEAVTQAAREMPEAEAAMEGKIALARGLLAQLSSRDTCGMREQALQAWEKLPPGNSMLRGLAAYLLGASHYWEGDPASAEPYYQQAIQLSRQAGNSFTTLVTVVDTCNVLREQGRYRRAYQLIAETQEELVRHGRAGHPMLGQLIINQGQILLQWNRLEEAERSLMRGMELINQDVPAEVLIFALISMAYLKLARGEQEEALGYAESCWQRTEDTSLTSVVARANLVRFWIYTGRVERVEEWLAASNLSPDDPISYLREREYMALAVVLLWQHKTDAALTVINRLVDLTGRSGRNGRRLYILALKALALQQSGDTEGSLACMGETLAAAQVEGYMRIYLDEGKPMENLLRLGLSRAAWRGTPFEAFVRSLLLAFQKQAGQDRPSALDAPLKTQQSAGLVEPLSSRELEVLTLSASGLSNMQVAAKLYLSEGTIKTHLHNIYGKLGVDNRIRAIQMARELGILV